MCEVPGLASQAWEGQGRHLSVMIRIDHAVWLLLHDDAASVDGIDNETTTAVLVSGKSTIDFDSPISGQFQSIPPDQPRSLRDMP